jgi:hypothetical protein
MSDFQYVVEDSSLIKPSQEAESGPQATPKIDPAAILSAPAGPGQSTVRAQAITQLQRTHGNQHVQRLVARTAGEENEMEGLAQAVDDRRGRGQSLTDRTRAQMEPALQQDLSGVRVHNDGAADQLSSQFNAKAFTTGQDVFFRQGAYDPGSSGGDKLLAHELTHVVQQGNSPTKLAGKKMNISEPGDAGEREADSVADMAVSAGVSRQEEELQMAAVDRQPIEEEEEILQSAVQRAEAEEEEILQPAVQREGFEEDDLQLAAVQRQPEPEEDEEAEPEKEEEEEVLQTAVQREEAQEADEGEDWIM